jgi:hypothetical protein
LVALFQGFILQAVWGKRIDVEASVRVIDRMLGGLAPSAASTTPACEKKNGR